MTSATVTGYVPETPTAYARPVQDENATSGLCGAEMPNGKGCLVWEVGGDVHFAVVDSPSDFIVNDVVPLGDIGVVVADGLAIPAPSVFYLDGELWCIVNAHTNTWSTSRGSIKLYKANSPTVPTSWSLFTTIQDVPASREFFFSRPRSAGIPLRLDSGRWVLPTMSWESNAFLTGAHVGVWTSDNAGASFTRRLDYSHASTGLPLLTHQSGQTAQEPTTGNLYIYSGCDGGATGMILWESTDSGTSWTAIQTDQDWYTTPHITPILESDGTLYAAGQVINTTVYSLIGDADFASDFTSTGTGWAAPGSSPDYTFRAVIASAGVYFFTADQVMYSPFGAPAWHFNVHWST